MGWIFQESDEDFLDRHGGKDAAIWVDGMALCPDGARMTASVGGITIRFEPSSDRVTLLRDKRRFLTIRLADLERDARALRSALLGKSLPFRWPARKYGPGPDSPVDALSMLKSWVDADRANLAEIEAALEAAEAPLRVVRPDTVERQAALRDLAIQEEVLALGDI